MIKKTSKIWSLIPDEQQASLVMLVEQLSKISSKWIDDQLKLPEKRFELLTKSNQLNIEPFYTKSTPTDLIEHFRRDFKLPIPQFSSSAEFEESEYQAFALNEIHSMALNFTPEKDWPESEKLVNDITIAKFLIHFRCFLTDLLSFSNFKKSVRELIESAESGNTKDFLRMIRADRNLIYSHWAQQRIMKAFWCKEEVFCISLSHAIQNPISFQKSKNKRSAEIFIVILLLGLGGYKFNRIELLKFLKDIGFYKNLDKNKVTELDTFTRSIHRFLKHLKIELPK